jgi:hypothetical protein
MIPDDVMREAVRAVDDMLFGPMPDDLRGAEIRTALEAALPILIPAIQEELIERMVDEIHGRAIDRAASRGVEYEGLSTGEALMVDVIASFLPTEDEEENHD